MLELFDDRVLPLDTDTVRQPATEVLVAVGVTGAPVPQIAAAAAKQVRSLDAAPPA